MSILINKRSLLSEGDIMEKCLWSANIIYTIEYETGLFKKITKRTVETREITEIFYDTGLMVDSKIRIYSDFYRADFVPGLFDIDYYKIIEKQVDPFIMRDATFDYLKNNMLAHEFIEYVHDTWGSLDKLVG
jgi:hypothetical protein